MYIDGDCAGTSCTAEPAHRVSFVGLASLSFAVEPLFSAHTIAFCTTATLRISLPHHSVGAAEDATGQGNMWTSAQMSEWLKETHDSPGAQWPAIQARMKQIALYTLIGAQDIVDKRNRSFELFGYVSHESACFSTSFTSSYGMHCVQLIFFPDQLW